MKYISTGKKGDLPIPEDFHRFVVARFPQQASQFFTRFSQLRATHNEDDSCAMAYIELVKNFTKSMGKARVAEMCARADNEV